MTEHDQIIDHLKARIAELEENIARDQEVIKQLRLVKMYIESVHDRAEHEGPIR